MPTLFNITATVTTIELEHGLGTSHELAFVCDSETTDKIILYAVRNGFPFERTNNGVKIFN